MLKRSLTALTLFTLGTSFSACHLHWSTVDDAIELSLQAAPNAVTTVEDAVFVVGTAEIGGNETWVVRRSRDRGKSWQTVSAGVPGYTFSRAMGAATGPDGALYVVGEASILDEIGERMPAWIVRRSTDLGATWETLEDRDRDEEVRFIGMRARAVTVTPDGNIFVAGVAYLRRPEGGVLTTSWMVRRSVDGGSSWATVDLEEMAADGTGAIPYAIAASSTGHVFVSGYVQSNRNLGSIWLVKHSPDGLNWHIADQYRHTFGEAAWSTGMAISKDGSVFAVGTAGDARSLQRWIVRRSHLSTPESWSTADEFVPNYHGAPDYYFRSSIAGGISITPGGRIYVTGHTIEAVPIASEPGGIGRFSYWVTRTATTATLAFSDSDRLRVGNSEPAGLFKAGVAVHASGDIFAAMTSMASPSDSRMAWRVRRLSREH